MSYCYFRWKVWVETYMENTWRREVYTSMHRHPLAKQFILHHSYPYGQPGQQSHICKRHVEIHYILFCGQWTLPEYGYIPFVMQWESFSLYAHHPYIPTVPKTRSGVFKHTVYWNNHRVNILDLFWKQEMEEVLQSESVWMHKVGWPHHTPLHSANNRHTAQWVIDGGCCDAIHTNHSYQVHSVALLWNIAYM